MTTYLNVHELDFDAVKEELITYLGAQTEFQDYDFTGSALNTLIDVCAYTIHYVGVQANFALREAFLESAQIRKNVSAIAKELGYFPSQKKAGRASFTITLDIEGEAQPPSITIPKGTIFTSTLEDGTSIRFTTYADNPLVSNGSGIWTGTVYVVQGIFVTREWQVLSDDQRYLIDQEGVDTDFLTVTTRPTQASFLETAWAYGKNVTKVDSTTQAYFLAEYQDGVEIFFGNNTIGKRPPTGTYVKAEFLVTRGAISNGLRVFSLVSDIEGYSSGLFSIASVSVNATTDASDRESIESIRKLAPLSYQRQNRIVTIEDYKSAVLENYSNVRAINAWGGEQAEPPQYGKVFVSVAPVYGDTVSPTTKKSIEEDILQSFSVVGITPEVVDPEYLQIHLSTTVTFNKDRTNQKASDIVTLCQEAIEDFFDEAIFDYNQSFKYSRFLAAVDAAHPAIVSSASYIEIGKSFTPKSNTTGTYEIKMYNACVPGTLYTYGYLSTTGTTLTYADDGKGRIDRYVNGVLNRTAVGSIDYDTGTISLPGFNANQQTVGQAITFLAQPVADDVRVKFNNLANLSTNAVTAVEEVR